MKFNDLTPLQKQEVHDSITDHANRLGGVNFLLHMIEDLQASKESSLSNKEMKFSFSKGFIKWN